MKFSNLFVIFLLFLVDILSADDDLYKVLGVAKSSSSSDIKKAYKKLAKEWHPDKNRDPRANEKFMKINEAYETLSDNEKRQEYDNFGRTSAQAGQQRGGGGFDGFQPFDAFFNGQGFSFNFGGGGRRGRESSVDRYRITLRAYESNILPESTTKPYLIYAYSDFCYQCMQVEMMFDRIVQDLDAIGMGVGTLHVQMEHRLTSKLKLRSVPSFVIILDGKPQWYSRSQFNSQLVRDFIRESLPSDTFVRVTDKNLEQFLTSWTKDNRVRMLFFDDRSDPSLRFLLAAFAHKTRVAAGYVQTNLLGTQDIKELYGIKTSNEHLLLFNEDKSSPMAQISMKTIARSTFDELIEQNRFLNLPRLSSQEIFNELCPPFTTGRKKKLCVVLLSKNSAAHEPFQHSFRSYAQSHHDDEQRVRYAYMWEETQAPFVRDITRGQGPVNESLGTLKVAVIWRKENKRLRYDWLEEGWYSSGMDLERSGQRLETLVRLARTHADVLQFSMEMSGDLQDEHANALWIRIVRRLGHWVDVAWDSISSMDEVTLLTLGTSIGFVIIIGCMMRALVVMEDTKSHDPQRPRATSHRSHGNSQPSRPTVYLHPLCSENFESLVLKAEPGVRALVVLVDEESRERLLRHFATTIHPYASSEAFIFGFLQLENLLPWFRRLLEDTLDNAKDLSNINIKNCLGTVLALNGPRRYYCIYHPQGDRMRRAGRRGRRHQGALNQEDAAAGGLRQRSAGGAFMGFEDSSSDSESDLDPEAVKMFTSDLLSGLGTWLERLCEGSVQRFRVECWPNMVSDM